MPSNRNPLPSGMGRLNFTPNNIFQYRGQRLRTRRGGWIVAKTRWVGGGWDVIQEVLPAPDQGHSDEGMMPRMFKSLDVDVWMACRLLNEAEVVEVGEGVSWTTTQEASGG